MRKAAILLLGASLLTALACQAQPNPGEILPVVSISSRGELYLDDKHDIRYRPWSSEQLKVGQTALIMYLPARLSSRSRMRPLQDALEAEHFVDGELNVVSMVNLMDATFGAGLMVAKELKQEKQKNPQVSFIVDEQGLGLTSWQLVRKQNAVILVAPSGHVVLSHIGKFTKTQVENIMSEIRELNRSKIPQAQTNE